MEEKEQTKSNIQKADELSTVASEIYNLSDNSQLESLVDAFMLAHIKKDALRSAKLSELRDLLISQLETRITKKPDEFSNKDLLDCINILSTQEQKSKDNVLNKDSDSVNIFKTSININADNKNYDRESNERVLDAVAKILENLKQETIDKDSIIDVTPSDIPEGEKKND